MNTPAAAGLRMRRHQLDREEHSRNTLLRGSISPILSGRILSIATKTARPTLHSAPMSLVRRCDCAGKFVNGSSTQRGPLVKCTAGDEVQKSGFAADTHKIATHPLTLDVSRQHNTMHAQAANDLLLRSHHVMVQYVFPTTIKDLQQSPLMDSQNIMRTIWIRCVKAAVVSATLLVTEVHTMMADSSSSISAEPQREAAGQVCAPCCLDQRVHV